MKKAIIIIALVALLTTFSLTIIVIYLNSQDGESSVDISDSGGGG